MENTKSIKQKIKKKNTTQRILGIITDIFIYPIIILAIIISGVMMVTRVENRAIPIFGFTFVRVLSGSMTVGGYNIGDVVILREIDKKDLDVGDVIAFYRYQDSLDPTRSQLVKVEDISNPPSPTSEASVCGTKTKKDAVSAKSAIIFHRIIGVYQAKDGTRFFETKGDSNSSSDGILIREEFVVGRDIGTPKWLLRVFALCFSSKGIIFFVILPLGVLIFIQLLEIFELVFALMTEKKVLALEVPFDSEESIKSNIGFEMRDFDKVYFYDITPDNQKDKVKDFLWGYLYEPQNKSERKQLDFVNAGLALYPDREKYWNYFIQSTKSSRNRKRLINLHSIANTMYASKKSEKEDKKVQDGKQKQPVQTEKNDASKSKTVLQQNNQTKIHAIPKQNIDKKS